MSLISKSYSRVKEVYCTYPFLCSFQIDLLLSAGRHFRLVQTTPDNSCPHANFHHQKFTSIFFWNYHSIKFRQVQKGFKKRYASHTAGPFSSSLSVAWSQCLISSKPIMAVNNPLTTLANYESRCIDDRNVKHQILNAIQKHEIQRMHYKTLYRFQRLNPQGEEEVLNF